VLKFEDIPAWVQACCAVAGLFIAVLTLLTANGVIDICSVLGCEKYAKTASNYYKAAYRALFNGQYEKAVEYFNMSQTVYTESTGDKTGYRSAKELAESISKCTGKNECIRIVLVDIVPTDKDCARVVPYKSWCKSWYGISQITDDRLFRKELKGLADGIKLDKSSDKQGSVSIK